jgi:hypothetical protein
LGEEIYTDEYGRVKVQFRWDRYGKADENSSMFLRLAQSWAPFNIWGIATVSSRVEISRIKPDGFIEIRNGAVILTLHTIGHARIPQGRWSRRKDTPQALLPALAE